MTDTLQALADQLKETFGEAITSTTEYVGELTLEVRASEFLRVCRRLRDDTRFAFSQLMDVCGVDYLHYGREQAHGPLVDADAVTTPPRASRFAVVYHLLSLMHNQRLRLRVFLDAEQPIIDSVVDLWPSANWFEREAFDLYGILFEGHPDLRRILTDYGFVGHPFRKDFPLSGHVEMRYDPEKQRVVYQPVSIEPRVTTPRVIREEGYGGRDS